MRRWTVERFLTRDVMPRGSFVLALCCISVIAGVLHFPLMLVRENSIFLAEVCSDLTEIVRPLLWLPCLFGMLFALCDRRRRPIFTFWGWLWLVVFLNSLIVNVLEHVDLYGTTYTFGFVFLWALLSAVLPEVLSVAATALLIVWVAYLAVRRLPDEKMPARASVVCGVGMGLYLFLSEELMFIIDFFSEKYGYYYASEWLYIGWRVLLCVGFGVGAVYLCRWGLKRFAAAALSLARNDGAGAGEQTDDGRAGRTKKNGRGR